MNGTVEPSSRSCTAAATWRGCTVNSVAMRCTILSATVSVMGFCTACWLIKGVGARASVSRVRRAIKGASTSAGLVSGAFCHKCERAPAGGDRISGSFKPPAYHVADLPPYHTHCPAHRPRLRRKPPSFSFRPLPCCGSGGCGGHRWSLLLLPQAASAQTPKPIDATTSVTEKPLDDARARRPATISKAGRRR